jgi:hypothetical protein
MSNATATLDLPVDAGNRLVTRLNRIAPDLFRLLDEAREHGGSYICTLVKNPATGELLKIVIAGPEVHIT